MYIPVNIYWQESSGSEQAEGLVLFFQASLLLKDEVSVGRELFEGSARFHHPVEEAGAQCHETMGRDIFQEAEQVQGNGEALQVNQALLLAVPDSIVKKEGFRFTAQQPGHEELGTC